MSIESVHPTPFQPPQTKKAAVVRPDEDAQKKPAATEAKPTTAKAPAPQEVVKAAAEAYATLRESARSLHFETTDTGLRIEVYDANGKLVRSIPPNELMARSMAKGTTWQA
jgi:hypothetical protein